MDFVDRDAELARLKAAAASQASGLLVVWGRRRVGKTRLLLEWVRSQGGAYWVADTSAAALQRKNLAEALEPRLPGFAEVEYPSWSALLTRLAREAKRAGWRGPIVLDELPYLISASPELPSVLQRFVDHDAREAKLVVALAGSSQRMMQGLALSPEAPLFGRAKELMKLGPLPAGYIGEALGLRDSVSSVQSYSVWGGIPRYWELAEPFPNFRAAVDSLTLDPLGPLHEEPSRLLLEESPPAIALRPLLDAIGAGAHRVSEIAGRIGQPATSLARPLSRLQELGLVVRELPFGEPERSSKRALYKLADPFLRLWFSLVAPKRSILLQVRKAARLKMFDDVYPRLASTAWEELCRQAVPLLAERLGNVDYGLASRYWASGDREWDVVAEATDGGTLLVGEAKWSDRAPSAQAVDRELRALMAKGPPVHRQGAEVHYALFFPALPKKRPAPPASNVHFIDASDVLAVLR